MSRAKITKGMILCAGLGTRLKPITHKIPKPLVPVLNVENVLHTIRLLERAGIEEIIVNLHYLPEHLESFLSRHPKIKAKIFFSKETVLLGTGGGVKKAEPFFEGKPFVLANCDFVTNLDVNLLVQEHFQKQSLATMLLYKNPKKEPKYSKVGIDTDGRLCSLPRLETKTPFKTGIFTGIHVIDATCLKTLEEKPSGINEILYPWLMKNEPDRVHGVFQDHGYWCDTGEVDTFLESSFYLLSELGKDPLITETVTLFTKSENSKPSSLIGSNCHIGSGTTLGPNVVVGEGCKVGNNCKVENSVLLPHSTVESNSTVSSSIYFESTQIKTP